MLNELSGGCVESNGGSIPHAKRSGRVPIAHGNRHIVGAIAVEKGLPILGTIGEEAPAFADAHSMIGEDDPGLFRTEQLWHHVERDTGNQVAKVIDMQDMRLDRAALPPGCRG